MASINKLSVRGVRAFSPEDDEQVVEFFFPCTIILGQNGCGKTTIIESLKYAITGGFPPNCRSGAAFVHDPKSIGSTTVKANVKLRFTSRSGQSMVVVRSMEVTQKKTTATFRQLDGVLRMMDPDTGERVSLSHKCTELDKQIPNLLGVSKPILEHVVFCHQEDASWPLQEGAVLKKKFDDIFDSTKYSKALKAFRDTEKDFLSKVKDLKADLAGLASHKHAAEGFQNELEEQSEKLEVVEETKTELIDGIENIEKKLETLCGVIEKIDKINCDIDERKNDILQEQAVLQKTRSMLQNDLTGKHSIRELEQMLHDFDQKISSQIQKKDDLELKYQKIKEEIEEKRNEASKYTAKMGKLQAEKEAHEKLLKERYTKMEKIARKYEMDLTQLTQSQSVSAPIYASLSQSIDMMDEEYDDNVSLPTISPADMQSFFQALQSKEEELKSSLNDFKAQAREEEDVITCALTKLEGELQLIENEKNRLSQEKRENEREMASLKDLGTSVRHRRTELEELKRRAAEAALKRDEINNNPRQKQIPVEIRQYEVKMDEIKRKIEDEERVLDELKQHVEAQHSLKMLEKQCEAEFEELGTSMQENTYSLNKYNIEKPDALPKDGDDDGGQLSKTMDTLLDAARDRFETADSQYRRALEDANNTQKIVSEKTALLASSQKTLATVTSKLQRLTNSVNLVKNTVVDLRRHETENNLQLNFDEEKPKELLQYLDERLESIEDEAPETISPKITKKIINKLKKLSTIFDPANPKAIDKIECPCCKRGMEYDDVKVFTKTMKYLASSSSPLVENDPHAMETYEQLKTTYKAIRKVVAENMDSLRDHRRLTEEVSELEKEMKRLQDDLSHYSSLLKNQNDLKEEAEMEVKETRELITTIEKWSENAGRVAEKRLQIHHKKLDLKAMLLDSTRDLKTVERAVAKLRDDKDNFMNEITKLNNELRDINDKISKASTQASNLEKSAREKEEKVAAELKARDRRNELSKRYTEIGHEEKKFLERIAPLEQKKRSKENERKKHRTDVNYQEQRLLERWTAFDGDVTALKSLSRQIDTYVQSNKSEEFEKISAEIDTFQRKAEEKQADLEELEPSLNQIRRAVEDQELHKKQLQQNIEILEGRERMKKLEVEIKGLENELNDVQDGDKAVYEEFEDLKKSKERLLQKKAMNDGIFQSHVEQIRALKRKLSSPEYKDVHEQYRVASIKHTTTKVAAEDLKKYGNALDKALLQFHGVKIKEINKIIRELWMMTYKGEDITNIEIQSGQEPGSRASKSYNYRVVMTKGGSKLDMRGRCSAGQRVLASIVIRLALAETFGVNCGCIALDEPTVNLDYENKKGLAVALAHIVASRAQQRNFQLIMITHDEEFVAMMKTELSSLTGFSMPEKYFQVCREESSDGKFYSKIKPVDWDELV